MTREQVDKAWMDVARMAGRQDRDMEVHELRAEIERLTRDLEIWKRNGGDILLRAEIERLRAALQTFAKCFGPLEDNHMLSDECRNCFALARAALKS